MVDIRSWGQVAYDAYCEDAHWKSVHDEHLPRWDQQQALIQRHWDAAAQAILDKLRRDVTRGAWPSPPVTHE